MFFAPTYSIQVHLMTVAFVAIQKNANKQKNSTLHKTPCTIEYLWSENPGWPFLIYEKIWKFPSSVRSLGRKKKSQAKKSSDVDKEIL